MREVDATRYRHVTDPVPQPSRGLLDGDERRGAGGVDGEGRAPQVEPVSGAAGHEVGDGRGHAVDVEPRQTGEHLPGQGLALGGGQAGTQVNVQAVDEIRPQEDLHHLVAGVATPADDQVGATAPVVVRSDGRVTQRLVEDMQQDELVDVTVPGHLRHDAKTQRIEQERCRDEPAPVKANVREVSRWKCRVAAAGPAVPGQRTDGVVPVDDVAPVAAQVRRVGKDTGHPDNGDVPLGHVCGPAGAAMRSGVQVSTTSAWRASCWDSSSRRQRTPVSIGISAMPRSR